MAAHGDWMMYANVVHCHELDDVMNCTAAAVDSVEKYIVMHDVVEQVSTDFVCQWYNDGDDDVDVMQCCCHCRCTHPSWHPHECVQVWMIVHVRVHWDGAHC